MVEIVQRSMRRLAIASLHPRSHCTKFLEQFYVFDNKRALDRELRQSDRLNYVQYHPRRSAVRCSGQFGPARAGVIAGRRVANKCGCSSGIFRAFWNSLAGLGLPCFAVVKARIAGRVTCRRLEIYVKVCVNVQ